MCGGSDGVGRAGVAADDHIAQAQFDRRGRPPHHPHRGGAAEVDPLGEVDPPAQVLGHRGRHEHVGLSHVGADQPVHVLGRQPGVVEREGGEIRPLFEGEPAFAGVLPLRRIVGNADDGRVSPQPHGREPYPRRRRGLEAEVGGDLQGGV